MKAHYRAFGGRLVIEMEGTTIKDLFQQIGPIAEVLDADSACGKCGSPNIYPRTREAKGFDFYELVCSDCKAKLSFGQFKDGSGLFPKRNDEHGNPMDFRGWHIYLALDAPKEQAKPPRSAPAKAAPDAPPDARLNAFLDRAKAAAGKPDELDSVLADVCQLIVEAFGQERMQREWMGGLKEIGDPVSKPSCAPALIRRLYAVATLKGKP